MKLYEKARRLTAQIQCQTQTIPIRSARFAFALVATLGSIWAPHAGATTYLSNDVEANSCNSAINDIRLNGALWDTFVSSSEPWVPTAMVRCAISTPNIRNYAEWQITQTVPTNGVGPEIILPSTISVSMGTTYYLGGFFRFQRSGSQSIWHDTGANPYSFDKLFEFRGTGWRWGIGVGWNGNYARGTAGTFVFDAWYAQSVLGNHGDDHLVADQSPYNASNPLLSNYDVWHGVVLGVTAANSDTGGRVQLWVDGIKVIDQRHYTANAGASINTAYLNGTIAQPAYDAPAHVRQADGLIITDNWQDIVSGGYLTTTSGTVSTPSTPTGLGVTRATSN